MQSRGFLLGGGHRVRAFSLRRIFGSGGSKIIVDDLLAAVTTINTSSDGAVGGPGSTAARGLLGAMDDFVVRG